MSLYPDFVDQATDTPACRSEDPDLFFPEKSETVKARKAKAVCRRCPLLAACEAWALAQSPTQLYGVWGGLSDYDRRQRNKGKPRRQPPGAGRHHHVIARMRAHNPPATWAEIGEAIGVSADAAQKHWRRSHQRQVVAA
ncbi:hypothetical protein M2302_000299 [Micromonospora sp. A200]|nr:hypothetical protein [Micromonospora sp. A200]